MFVSIQLAVKKKTGKSHLQSRKQDNIDDDDDDDLKLTLFSLHSYLL